MKKNSIKRIIITVSIIIGIVIFPYPQDVEGYQEFEKSKQNIENIIITKVRSKDDYKVKINDQKEVENFITNLNLNEKKYVSYLMQKGNCRCRGEYDIKFNYHDGSNYTFQLAHYTHLKIENRDDLYLTTNSKKFIKNWISNNSRTNGSN